MLSTIVRGHEASSQRVRTASVSPHVYRFYRREPGGLIHRQSLPKSVVLKTATMPNHGRVGTKRNRLCLMDVDSQNNHRAEPCLSLAGSIRIRFFPMAVGGSNPTTRSSMALELPQDLTTQSQRLWSMTPIWIKRSEVMAKYFNAGIGVCTRNLQRPKKSKSHLIKISSLLPP
jgi:hypothetical protein